MRLFCLKNTVLLFLLFSVSCSSQPKKETATQVQSTEVQTGANQTEKYLPLLVGKRVAIVANQTSIITQNRGKNDSLTVTFTHLVDSLVQRGINVVRVFAPEHGFRGNADAGELVADGKDIKTGIPIVSLYGKNKKLTAQQLEGIDIVVFDIQDVGVRFYTYIATMQYVMEATAKQNIPFVILDRPNPNGHYIDGPTMLAAHTSFLGLNPIPLVHGMTIGEYAQMLNGESWLSDGVVSKLTVITCLNYSHDTPFSLAVRPSPNLPNDKAINLYPSLGLLEGTTLNAGRGTEMQFQVFGDPKLPKSLYPFTYTPEANFGSKYPKHQGASCNGLDLRQTSRMSQVDLTWIIEAYKNHPKKELFFNTKNFSAHAGTPELQEQIEAGMNMEQIRESWQEDLEAFKKIRNKYLLYE